MINKRVAGIWLDHKEAVVVINHDGKNPTEFRIVETSSNYDPVQHLNEQARQNAEQTNLAKFFKEIEQVLTNTDELYITGPGTAQEQLKRHLLDTAQYKDLKIELDTAEQMSEEEVLKTVKKHYNA